MSKKAQQKPKAAEAEAPAEIPCNEAVEKSLLGSIMLDNENFYTAVAAGLRPEFFHFGWTRAIYTAMSEVLDSGVRVDMLTLVNYLESQDQLKAAGDVGFISSLVEGVPDTGAQIAWHVKVLRETALRRDLMRMGRRLVGMSADPADPVDSTLAGAHEELLRMQGESEQEAIVSMSSIGAEVLAKTEEMMGYHPDRTIGVPFGIADLDEATSGMREGQLIVLGGFPASGKTSFALDSIRKAVKTGVPIGFFSREMRRTEVYERLQSQESEIPYMKIRKPMHMGISEFRRLQQLKSEMDDWPLYIDDQATHIRQIIPRAHMLIRQKKVELLVVDYLQIIEAAFEKEYERVSYVANALTSLSKATGVPVLALSQLTRPEGRKGDLNVMPTMGMLRSSGQIEQNAHLILFTYHPIDKQTSDPNGEDLAIIGKQRAGPTGRCKCFFNVGIQRWEERGPEVNPPAKQQEIFANSKREDYF